jgi:hypothetical protein
MLIEEEHHQAGNRCGHAPLSPRLFIPPGEHKTRPKILVRLMTAIESYYHSPAKVIPSLNFCNGSSRRQRSERREACLILLAAIIHYTDLATLKVGVPSVAGSFANLTTKKLSEVTAMGLRRTQRALLDLSRAGLLSIQRVSKQIDGIGYRGLAAIKRVNPVIFQLFGLGIWLAHEQRRAADRSRIRARHNSKSPQKAARWAMARTFVSTSLQSSSFSHEEMRSTERLHPAEHFKRMRDLLNGV